LVILEEAWPFGSVASEITYMVQQKAFDYLDAPIKRITTPDAPAPYSAALFAEWFPKLEKVKEEIKKAMYVKIDYRKNFRKEVFSFIIFMKKNS
jgi:pyruvate dehydrogenase E1 component beta subunit